MRAKAKTLAILVVILLSVMPSKLHAEAGIQEEGYTSPILLVGLRAGQSVDLLPVLQSTGALATLPDVGLGKLGVQALQVPPTRERELIASLSSDPRVAFVERDYRIQVLSSNQIPQEVVPNDPGWIEQWALKKINAPNAWSYSTGDPGVTIAVLDSGLQLDHPDLSGKLWTNSDEIPGNGIDDDDNGKVDDMHGWHYYHYLANEGFLPREDHDIWDDLGHGTHVAGIAAAATDNAVGIAGVSWGANVMPVKVIDQYGYGWYSDISAGIIYAVDNGAQVINLSLGGEEASETLRLAVDYAKAHGVLVVAASGNTNGAVLYPAAYKGVVAVAATDQGDQRAEFSNYGSEVDLAAPGVDIYSTWYRSNYFAVSGTSMSAPHVSGVIALLWALKPDLKPDAITEILCDSAVDVDLPGIDPYTGCGRLDAFQSLRRIAEPADIWINQAAPRSAVVGEPISFTYGNLGIGESFGVVITNTWFIDGQPFMTSTLHVGDLPPLSGPYTETLAVIAPTAGITISHLAKIGSSSIEANSENNQTGFDLFILHKIIFPLIYKR